MERVATDSSVKSAYAPCCAGWTPVKLQTCSLFASKLGNPLPTQNAEHARIRTVVLVGFCGRSG